MSVTKTFFDTMPTGEDIYELTIENNNKVKASILTLGATLHTFCCEDKSGNMGDIIMGFDKLDYHINSGTFAGKTVGQYANRIAKGKFKLDDKEFDLTINNGENCLHGGGEYSSAIWRAIIVDDDAVEFSYKSEDGAHGFPANVEVSVTYVLTDRNELEIHYKATPDAKTVINMTNHAYFNLGTIADGDILDHKLQLFCSNFTPTDENSIPTGEIRAVKGTAFDFTEPKTIGQDINQADEQLIMARGYDHNFCIDGELGKLKLAAKVFNEKVGRKLEVYTDMPGVQLYTANFIDGTEEGKDGVMLQKHHGFCLETQFYPDTPNQASFPQCTFDKGETFKSLTIFKV